MVGLIKDIPQGNLKDYFSPAAFRTVDEDALGSPGGITEIFVIFYLHEKFTKRLTFAYSSALVTYGFVRMNDRLVEMNKDRYNTLTKGALEKITCNDSGEVFILNFEYRDGSAEQYLVSPDDVADLLNKCIHPNLIATW